MFNQEEVIKCVVCDKYFGYSEKDKNCRLCGATIEEALKGRGNSVKLKVKDEETAKNKKAESEKQNESEDGWKDSFNFKVWE